jgi:lipoprotein-releasing system ATP-binding protein
LSAAPPILELADVHKAYNVGTPVETEVLHGIDLVLAAGEFAALIGPSGSGKSTLLNTVGLLERPTSGRILIDGRDIGALDESALTALRGRTIGFVFQFHHLLPAFSALENVMMPLVIDRGRSVPGMAERAEKLLRDVGLGNALHKKPAELSGGMQQRVAIARALAMSPPLVLADEPTGNLDTHTADDVFALMRRFNAEEGVAFLIVTHDPRLAGRCDRRIELVDGRVVDGATA